MPDSPFRVVRAALLVASLAAASRAGEIPAVGDVAPDFTLATAGGEKVRLGEAASAGPVVLVVLRGYPGYQCPACTAQVADLAAKAERLRAAKARVILLYPGPAENLKNRAGEFLADKTLPEGFTLVIDPDYSVVNAYGLRWDAPSETAYPSTFVLDGDRKVRFAKVSKTHGDRARAADVIEALGTPR